MNRLKQVKARQSEKGFTIIEVVLVLAIAGLIFLMVFIALPALQRNQRDTQRKTDMGRLSTALVNYTNSNRGSLPSNWTTFTSSYLTTGGDDFLDPAGATSAQSSATTYIFTDSTTTPLTTTYANGGQNVIFYSTGYVCGSSSDSIVAGGSRKVAFRIVLEGGGYYCVNN